MNSSTVDTGLEGAIVTSATTGARPPRMIPLASSWTKDPQTGEGWESSTAWHPRPAELGEELQALFDAGKEEVFEDGMESEFSAGLVALISRYRNDALAELAYFIVYEKVNAEVASEALRWLGLINHPSSYQWRLWLLERSLRCSSARVRDGASLGIAFLGDSDAIPYIKHAIQQEPVKELREDMQQVLLQLESSHRCRTS